jgi:PST family polysaccharide transporter
MLPVQQLSAPVGSVLVPAFSRIQSDAERFARYYLRVANLMMWLIAPTFGFLFVAAEPVILLVLGSQWRAAPPVFQILVISALGQPLFQLTIWSLVSRGQSKRLLRVLIIMSPIMVGSFAIGLPFGIKGVALSGSLIQVAMFPWILRLAFRDTNLTLQRLGHAIVCPVLLSLAGICSAELALRLVAPQRVVSQLLVVTLAFAAVYSLSALIAVVREEMASFMRLLNELRPSTQIVRSTA